MNPQDAHPPTQELNKFSTHELVFEVLMYDSNKEFGEVTDATTKLGRDRYAKAKAELARRYKKGWIATGIKAEGGD